RQQGRERIDRTDVVERPQLVVPERLNVSGVRGEPLGFAQRAALHGEAEWPVHSSPSTARWFQVECVATLADRSVTTRVTLGPRRRTAPTSSPSDPAVDATTPCEAARAIRSLR